MRQIRDFVISEKEITKMLAKRCGNFPEDSVVLAMFYDFDEMCLRIRTEHKTFCIKQPYCPIYREKAEIKEQV